MENSKKQNAVAALLEEYTKAIHELQTVISDITETELTAIADPVTKNTECISIQTVLTHAVSSAYSYCVYIQNNRNIDSKRPEQKFRRSASDYSADLDMVIAFTNETFAHIYDNELEEFDDSKKIATQWGQTYDIEQITEHAIVHILRHKRQIVNFIRKLRNISLDAE